MTKKDSNEDLIVSKEEITKEVEKVEGKKVNNKHSSDDEPSWYHYIFVIFAIFAVFAICYYTFEFYDNTQNSSENETIILTQTYNYPYSVGNVTYNIKFHSPVEEISSLNYSIEINKYDLFNTITLSLAFMEYNGSDNGQISIGATKLTSFLKRVYHFNFPKERFKMIDELNCSNSTINNRVIILNPYSNESGVFVEDNGCIKINSNGAENFVKVVDNFIYSLTQE